MLQRKNSGCHDCSESSSCEFSSEFCPKTILELNDHNALANDHTFKKYQELYRRSEG